MGSKQKDRKRKLPVFLFSFFKDVLLEQRGTFTNARPEGWSPPIGLFGRLQRDTEGLVTLQMP